ncbi:MAG TPA: ABC transporter permease [Vicinamibacterales bacterium]|nr:ABC transporter permease [Vicinamibacterales bacterium]
MTQRPRPPRLPRALASLLLRGEAREVVVGDLDEEFARQIAAGAARRDARRRYWRQALASIASVNERGATRMVETAAARQPGNRSGAADGLLLDVRHALRVLSRTRGFTAVAVLSLAIGIGGNAAIFSVIRVLLLDQMAVRAPDELSLVYWSQPGKYSVSSMNSSGKTDPVTKLDVKSNVSYPIYEDIRRATPEGFQVAGFNFLRDVVVQYADQPALQAGGLLADGNFFPVVGPGMASGRPLSDADDVEGGTIAAVLSHAFWLRAFGGDPAVINKPIRLNGQPAVVVGVTAATFRGITNGGFFPVTDITVPLRAAPMLQPRWNVNGRSVLRSETQHWVRVIARSSVTADRAAAARAFAAAIAPHMAPQIKEYVGPPAAHLLPGGRGLDQTSDDTRRLLFVLMGVVGIVLLIACVNLASLMLARGVARQREMAVRRALGAGRGRLIRGLMIEGVLLAIGGGAGGLLLTFWARKTLTTLLTAGIGTAPLSRQPIEVSVDPGLIVATFGLSLIAAMLFSLLPALRLTRASSGTEMKHQVVGAPTPKLTIGRLLVAVQIGVSIPLVVGAILFLRTLSNLGSVDLGFDPKGIVFFQIDPSKVAPTPPEQSAIYQELQNRIAAIPGVSAVSMIENVLLGGLTSNTQVQVDGKDVRIAVNGVGPGFLETMGMRLIAGRAPGIQDRPGSPEVVALNETAAKTIFGSESPLGKTLKSFDRSYEIVGVINDSLYARQREPVKATMFPSALQRAGYGGNYIVLRTSVPAETLEAQLRRAVAEVHRDLPVPQVRSQVAQIQDSTIRERVFTEMLMLFGGFALLLACIGLHGVTSYSVARRTSEMGIRLALGAQRRQVLWLVQRQVIVLAVAGLAIGVPLAVMAAPLVGALLFGVAPTDYAAIAIAGAVMLIVATGAGLLPARRAARLDPLKALRTE